MKKILVKSAFARNIVPFNPETDVNDMSGLRIMPSMHMPTYAEPLPVTGKNLDFERMSAATGGDVLPGAIESAEAGTPVHGTWTAPPSLPYLAEPDLSYGWSNRPISLVGVLGAAGQPDWSSGPKQGRLANEGFSYGGIPQSAYRNIELPKQTTVRDLSLGTKGALLEHGIDLGGMGLRHLPSDSKIRHGISHNQAAEGVQNALHAAGITPTGGLEMWDKPKIRDEIDFQRLSSKNPLVFGRKVASEPMDLAWRMLKAQQTIDAYSSENVEEGFEPGTQNIIISSKPGKENPSPEEQSRLHDEMLRQISELEGSEGIRIMSGRGRSEEWGDENSFMLTGVPDDMLPHIHSLAGEYGQDSILHSPEGTAGTQFVDSSGESDGGLEEGGFTEGMPPNYTEFPTGQKYAYGDYVAASEPMPIGDVLVKNENDVRAAIEPHPIPADPLARDYWQGKLAAWKMRETGEKNMPEGYHPGYGDEDESVYYNHRTPGGLNQRSVHPWWYFQERAEPPSYQDFINPKREDEFYPDMDYPLPKGRTGDFTGIPFNEETGFTRSEPMPIGDVLIKDRVSPEAKRHKLEYDTAYEANPERRKYRADLNRERRKRGMYGDRSGRDISHTEGGKLTVEGAHENRGRHFKDKGTLRHIGVKKKANDERKANLVNVVPPLKGENE